MFKNLKLKIRGLVCSFLISFPPHLCPDPCGAVMLLWSCSYAAVSHKFCFYNQQQVIWGQEFTPVTVEVGNDSNFFIFLFFDTQPAHVLVLHNFSMWSPDWPLVWPCSLINIHMELRFCFQINRFLPGYFHSHSFCLDCLDIQCVVRHSID